MKLKKYTIDDIYYKKMEQDFKQNNVMNDDTLFTYFTSYYLNVFLHTDLKIKASIGLKRKEQKKDVFIILIPFDTISKDKDSKKFFKRYFETGIRKNERYVGLIKTNKEIGFIFKHDEELLNAYKTGQYSKISDSKKSKMKKLKVIDFDTRVGAFYVVGNENGEENTGDWKNYPLGKRDILMYELYKMIHPEYFYPVLAQQFNVNKEYLKKNQVQILPKPNFEKQYLELAETEELYWFDKK